MGRKKRREEREREEGKDKVKGELVMDIFHTQKE